MEGIGDILLQIGALLGGGGAVAALLTYMRARRKDSMDAYSDLVGKLEVRCEKLENRCDLLDEQIKAERIECAAELAKRDARIDGLERQLAQVGAAGAHMIEKIASKVEGKR